MGVLDPTSWMPAGMPTGDKDDIAAAYPGDPHAAAAVAWEVWAATVQDDGTVGVQSVTTGAQTVTYAGSSGSGVVGDALRRAAWHRSRARVRSVEVGPTSDVEARHGRGEDWGTIPTFDAGTIP